MKKSTITAITLENFKAFGVRTTIPIKPLTVLSGMNSSGKSSIYQSLLLLAQSRLKAYAVGNSLVYSLVLNGDLIHIGKSDDIFYDKNSHIATIGLRFSSGKEIISSFTKCKNGIEDILQLSNQYVKDDNFSYSVSLIDGLYQVKADNYFQFFDNSLFNAMEKWLDENAGDRSSLSCKGYASHIELQKVKSIHMQGESLYLVRIDKEYIRNLIDSSIIDRMDDSEIKNLVERVDECVGNKGIIDLIPGYHVQAPIDFSLHAINFIPPFRGFPKRFYSIIEKECFAYDYEVIKDKITIYRYENDKKIKDTFQIALNYWVNVFLGENKKIEVKNLEGLVQVVYIEDEKNNQCIPLNNLGFGVGQILPILYKCLSAGPGRLLIIDEPETHLHPSMQSKLADFFIQMALLGRKIIVETHSEYILDKLIYHCIKTSKARDVTELYWVTNDSDGSSALPIAYDDLGYVSNAPEGFLSEKAKLVEELTTLRFAKLDNIGVGL